MDISMIKRALDRNLNMKSYRPYARVLASVRARGDVWMVSQGQYVAWWHRRQKASLSIHISNRECMVGSDLQDAVFEKHAGEFLTSRTFTCQASTFSGELQLVVDDTLQRKHLLAEALRREGIMNFALGQKGEFFLSHELDGVLERMAGHLHRQEMAEFDETIVHVRNHVAAMLAKHGLPLVRIWYHPRINGTIIKGVFSPRHDVERALTNVPKIIRLEHEHNTTSSVYIRVFQPFYTDDEIRQVAALPYPIEIDLHAEFAAHAEQHGSAEAAARADKAHLERITGCPVLGVSNHGGELFENYTPDYWGAVEGAGFLWTVSQAAFPYYLPHRWLNDDGQLSKSYCICYQFRDIGVSYENFDEAFHEAAMQHLDEAVAHNGILVLMFHPAYFGFFSYLLMPKNFFRLLRFMPTYLGRVLNRSEEEKA